MSRYSVVLNDIERDEVEQLLLDLLYGDTIEDGNTRRRDVLFDVLTKVETAEALTQPN